jgi:DNA-binding NtrC family response regulator
MPNMKGMEVFKGLKEVDPDVKVVLSTGYSRTVEARAMLREGVLGFIQKPFTEKKLSRVVRNVLDTQRKKEG